MKTTRIGTHTNKKIVKTGKRRGVLNQLERVELTDTLTYEQLLDIVKMWFKGKPTSEHGALLLKNPPATPRGAHHPQRTPRHPS